MKMWRRHVTQALASARRILTRWGRKSPGRFWSREGPDESEVSRKSIWQQRRGLSKHAICGASHLWGFAPVDL